MKMKSVWLASLFVVSSPAIAHGGKDPLVELKERRSHIASAQQQQETLTDLAARLDNLDNQLFNMQANVLILRNLIATDYPHVDEGMSKYRLDYMDELEKSLRELRKTIVQARALVDEQEDRLP